MGTLTNPLGVLMGFSLGSVFIANDSGKRDVVDYLWFAAVINTAMCLPIIVFFKEKPPFYPSVIAKNAAEGEKFSFKDAIK